MPRVTLELVGISAQRSVWTQSNTTNGRRWKLGRQVANGECHVSNQQKKLCNCRQILPFSGRRWLCMERPWDFQMVLHIFEVLLARAAETVFILHTLVISLLVVFAPTVLSWWSIFRVYVYNIFSQHRFGLFSKRPNLYFCDFSNFRRNQSP